MISLFKEYADHSCAVFEPTKKLSSLLAGLKQVIVCEHELPQVPKHKVGREFLPEAGTIMLYSTNGWDWNIGVVADYSNFSKNLIYPCIPMYTADSNIAILSGKHCFISQDDLPTLRVTGKDDKKLYRVKVSRDEFGNLLWSDYERD